MARKGEGKIDAVRLREMLQKKVPQKEIAKHFGVTDSAITHYKKKLQRQITRAVGLEKAHEVVQHDLDLIRELKKINQILNDQMGGALKSVETAKGAMEKTAVQKLIVDLAGELRRQIDTAVRVAEFWFDHEEFMRFREEVLDVLDECKPGLRGEIIERLKQKRLLRGAARLS